MVVVNCWWMQGEMRQDEEDVWLQEICWDGGGRRGIWEIGKLRKNTRVGGRGRRNGDEDEAEKERREKTMMMMKRRRRVHEEDVEEEEEGAGQAARDSSSIFLASY